LMGPCLRKFLTSCMLVRLIVSKDWTEKNSTGSAVQQAMQTVCRDDSDHGRSRSDCHNTVAVTNQSTQSYYLALCWPVLYVDWLRKWQRSTSAKPTEARKRAQPVPTTEGFDIMYKTVYAGSRGYMASGN
jgi:hypothetical protein